MILTLLMLQVIITQVLNQTHQEVIAQLNDKKYPVPVVSQQDLAQAIRQSKDITFIASTPERQFYSAEINICEENNCYKIQHIFSARSAILKEDIRFHAKRLK